MVRGDRGSIQGRVIPKTQKMVLDAALLNTQHDNVRIKGKVEQSSEGVAPSPTHWCSSYRKGEPSGHPRLRSPILLRIDVVFGKFFSVLSIQVNFALPSNLSSIKRKSSRIVYFDLIWFYGISTLVTYLMPTLVYTYVLNIYDL